MKTYKIAHIHSDKKFIKLSDTFFCPEFTNQLAFIGKSSDCDDRIGEKITFFDGATTSPATVAEFCFDFDMVVFYSLDKLAVQIVLQLPPTIKVGWRFFGYELYDKHKDRFVTKQTKKILSESLSVKAKVKNSIKKLLHLVSKPQSELDFKAALSRCDLFFGLYDEEYALLKGMYPNMPQFLPISFHADFLKENHSEIADKENYFLVGNSRNLWNNHFEILDIIRKSKNEYQNEAVLFLNYGQKGYYFEKLKTFANALKGVRVIDDFLAFDEFVKIYSKCAALVINSKRQLGGNNIHTALRSGTKVYLSTENSFYHSMVRLKFFVYTIEDFEKDYAEGNLKLDAEKANHNSNLLLKLASERSYENFQKAILKFLIDEPISDTFIGWR